MEPYRLYPVGLQTFSELRTKNYLYIDKTGYVYRMTHSGAKYVFLNRPRRFGKSLLVSTLHAYFEGRKELFEGLTIENLEKEWTTYPVLRFDMSLGKHMDREQLERYLDFRLKEQEELFGITTTLQDANNRLTHLITTVYRQTGRQVVVLIDEYDAPLLDVVHEEKDLPVMRNVMRNFYSPLKACDPYLRFVFLTGITKFSQLSIFSELNNIRNISMLPEYAAICGITQEEMETQMSPDLDVLATRQKKTREETLQGLKERYDGYHFSWPSPDIYNPFSLLNAFNDRRLNSYWFGSGTPTYLIEMLNKYHVIPRDWRALGNRLRFRRSDGTHDEHNPPAVPKRVYHDQGLRRAGGSLLLRPPEQGGAYRADGESLGGLCRPRAGRGGDNGRLLVARDHPGQDGRGPAAVANVPLHRPLLRQHGLRGSLPTDALRDLQPDG